MKNSFIRLLLRDIKNYIRTNRFFLIAEAALFLIGCMIADMQKPDSYGKYTTIQYYMQIFRGCYPFTDARTEVFQVPLTWFTLMYFCIYTALLYPIRDASGAGIHVLLRAKSRALWWFSKCLALTVWNLLYFAVGFCSVLRQKGKLIVLTCHDRQQMESLADEIIAMREGRIVNVDKNCHEEV